MRRNAPIERDVHEFSIRHDVPDAPSFKISRRAHGDPIRPLRIGRDRVPEERVRKPSAREPVNPTYRNETTGSPNCNQSSLIAGQRVMFPGAMAAKQDPALPKKENVPGEQGCTEG